LSKRSSIFAIIWLALWTLGAFVAITQFWLLPEEAPLSQSAVLIGVLIFCAIAWLITVKRLATLTKRP